MRTQCPCMLVPAVQSLSAFWLSVGAMMVAQYLACLCDIAACLSGSSEVAELAHCTDNIAQVRAAETSLLTDKHFQADPLAMLAPGCAFYVLLEPRHAAHGPS